jgi:hypothetical protein
MPQVRHLNRLLHNRIVRRVLAEHPSAALLLLVTDLVDGVGMLRPAAVWDHDGIVLADAALDLESAAWPALAADLRPELALLARSGPVEPFATHLLGLRLLDLWLERRDTGAAGEEDVSG